MQRRGTRRLAKTRAQFAGGTLHASERIFSPQALTARLIAIVRVLQGAVEIPLFLCNASLRGVVREPVTSQFARVLAPSQSVCEWPSIMPHPLSSSGDSPKRRLRTVKAQSQC